MSELSDDDEEALLDELEHIRKFISDLLKSGDQLLALFLTGVVTAFFTAKVKEFHFVVRGLPLALAILGAYVLRLNGLIQHAGGFRKAVEEALNAHHKRRVFLWEATAAPLQKKSLHGLLLTAILALFFIVSLSYALKDIADGHVRALHAGILIAAYLVEVIALALSWRSSVTIFSRAYEATRVRLGEGLP